MRKFPTPLDPSFRKSSYSTSGGDNCVEVAFRASSHSAPNSNNCVEVADLPRGVAVRDSQNPRHGHLAFGAAEWSAFLNVVTGHDL
ncbi:hypothetical protein HNR23_004127 [Nocardiopsis mwathae]|uniref:DUF397 domain-containing protein n=1 Tax=Nocardiopsis mwathae TaxID=1472723 RepID=A0A7W9YL47_9ACTN|nr:DUF397 domain-containing protein [Nocardiopsis mwathae]MBB6174067.1 hypothetical protein [Nocardiopsis mwathae]